jgi:poly(A) polymerase
MRIDPQPWMTAQSVTSVLAALGTVEGRAAARFVGGCVRDVLLGRQVKDIDLATPLVPTEVMSRLAKAGIKVVPTGLDHGTVTAIGMPGHLPIEITTLRRDVATDGRHATVVYTNDWHEDAARRDFTVNALYADQDGELHDYFDGQEDLAVGRIRFVGDARRRIEEDHLRLLRFFRFYAQFGRPPADAEALAACTELAAGIGELSGERIAKETFRLLEVPNPIPALRLMKEGDILRHVDPNLTNIDVLEALVGLQDGADPLRRLLALLSDAENATAALSSRFRLSNAVAKRLETARTVNRGLAAEMNHGDACRVIYRMGKTAFEDAVWLQWANTPESDSRSLLEISADWTVPTFPVGGEDARNLGLEEGPEIGSALKAVEDWWADGGFSADRDACLAELRRTVGPL